MAKLSITYGEASSYQSLAMNRVWHVEERIYLFIILFILYWRKRSSSKYPHKRTVIEFRFRKISNWKIYFLPLKFDILDVAVSFRSFFSRIKTAGDIVYSWWDPTSHESKDGWIKPSASFTGILIYRKGNTAHILCGNIC